jgi:uncharacterized protein (TIGR02302 family)
MEAPIEQPLHDPDLLRRRIRLPRFRIWLARWAILWERFWPSFWPTFVVVSLFVIAALFDLFPLLPGWLHLAFLIGFAAAFAYALGRIWPTLRFPGFMEGLRRIERVNELVHRPLTGLADDLATSAGDPAASRLWERYRRQIAHGIGRLRVGLPQAGFMERDPFALRVLLGLVLLIAVVGGWRDAPERLLRALTPNLSSLAATGPVNLTLSLTPPAYTNLAPIFLEVGDKAEAGGPADTPSELRLPIGTSVLAILQGGSETPNLMLGQAATPFAVVEPGAYQVKAELRTGDRLAVTRGDQEIAGWPLTIIPDQPPSIAFTTPPGESERKALRIAYAASDDYGLASVTATIRRADGRTGPGKIDEIRLPLTLSGSDPRRAQETSYHDLTPHPWAGLPVKIQLTAKDAIGQTATSDVVEAVLPERIFHHPIARAVIEQRKRLIANPDDRRSVARALYAIAAQPPVYNDDLVVVLGLQVAQRRLTLDPTGASVDSVQALLWELALRIEEGDLAVAERELRRLQQALQDALANGASDEEIERLMNELQQAMDQFVTALTEKMKRDMEQGGRPHQRQFDPNMMEVHREDLQKMLDRARELAKGGARDAARNLLSQLQEMLENMQAMPYGQQTDPATAEAMQLLDDMDKLAKRQQELLDQTFRHSQQMGEGQESMPNGDPGAADQEGLRRELGDLMRRYGEMMGDIPRPLGRAERAMRDASEALKQGRPGDAIDPQSQALGELQKGMQDMANAMMQQLRQQAGRQPGQEPNGQGRDPLGRNENGTGAIDTTDVKIPEQSDVQRARELIDELRRRSGDRARPKVERDYIDRLLKRF